MRFQIVQKGAVIGTARSLGVAESFARGRSKDFPSDVINILDDEYAHRIVSQFLNGIRVE